MTPRLIRSLALPVLAAGFLLLSSGCAPKAAEEKAAEPPATAQAEATPSVEKARELARISLEIEKEPGRATVILESHGMTTESFENLLYVIAEDAASSEAYEAERAARR